MNRFLVYIPGVIGPRDGLLEIIAEDPHEAVLEAVRQSGLEDIPTGTKCAREGDVLNDLRLAAQL